MTTTQVDSQSIAASSGGTSTPVKLTLNSGTHTLSAQMLVTTTRSATPGIEAYKGRRFTLFWAFSPDSLTLDSTAITALRHCAKSQQMELNKDIELAGQRIQISDKVRGQYCYFWFEYPTSTDAYAVVLTATELFFLATSAVVAVANSAGNTTITPTGSSEIDVITITGVARTSKFILSTTGRSAGDTLELRFVNPATAAIVLDIRNATAGGTQLYSYTTDGTGFDNAYFKLYFDGTAWKALLNVVPIN